jgi:HEAT repeat protein
MKFKRSNHLILALSLTLAAIHLPALAQSGGKDVYQALVKREFGTAVDEMTAIEKQIQAAKPEEGPAIEARLIAVLETPEATMPGKQFACQMLRLVGSRTCVPAIAKLLRDEQLTHMARSVLLGMNDPAAADALREALGTTQGNVRIGLINTIGDRGDSGSLPALAGLLTSGDEATTDSALAAVGKIGGTDAATILEGAKGSDAAKPAWAQAYLRCAGGLAAKSEAARAQQMYRALLDGNYPSAVRAGAFREIVSAQKEQAVPMIVQTLGSNDKVMKRAALAAVITVPGHAATAAFAQRLATLAPEAQATLLGALAARGDAEGLIGLVHKLARDENAALREAAIKALGRVGNASSVPVLVAALPDTAGGALASQALVELHGDGVADSLIQQVKSGDATLRAQVLGVLADRRQIEALPVARQTLRDADAKLRQAAVKVLSELGTQEDLQHFCDAILTTKDGSERDLLARAISAIGSRLADKAKRDDCVLQSFAQADAPTKVQLLQVLAAFGGDKALEATRRTLAEPGEVHKAAVRSLAAWPDTAPLADLRKAAKEETDQAIQILALRGSIKMIGQARWRAEEKVQALREAMELSTRPAEKRQVLSELSKVNHADALKIVEPCLGDDNLKREAWQAYERIAEALTERQPAVAKAALQKVLAATTDQGLREKAQAALERIK